MIYPAIDQFLVPLMVRFFFVFGIIGFVVGVGLVFDHVRMHQFFGIMNHWVSTRRYSRWLAIPRDMDSAVKRSRRLVGGMFILVAAYSTFVLIAQIDVARVVAELHFDAPQAFVAWVIESMRWFLIGGGMVAITVGTMLIFFPIALRVMEAHANHWYPSFGRSQSGDAMHMGFDGWVESHPCVMGWIIALGALVVAANFGMRLFVSN